MTAANSGANALSRTALSSLRDEAVPSSPSGLQSTFAEEIMSAEIRRAIKFGQFLDGLGRRERGE